MYSAHRSTSLESKQIRSPMVTGFSSRDLSGPGLPGHRRRRLVVPEHRADDPTTATIIRW